MVTHSSRLPKTSSREVVAGSSHKTRQRQGAGVPVPIHRITKRSSLKATPRLGPARALSTLPDGAGDGAGATAQASRSSWRRRLVIMVKAPAAGRVKTRLARDIGVVAATAFYRHASGALVSRLGNDPRWDTTLAVAPDIAAHQSHWPFGMSRRAQGRGDLGRRMQRIFDRMPPGPVVIIGSDCTVMGPADVAAAFAALGDADAVLGPATDGGYWLIGERRSPRPLKAFAGVRWSSDWTLADTLRNFDGRRVSLVRELPDVDTGEDLRDIDGASFAARRVRAKRDMPRDM